MKFLLLIAIFIVQLLASDKLAFLSLIDNSWKVVIYTPETKQSLIIKTKYEPHGFDYNFEHNILVYLASDQKLRIINKDGNESILINDANHKYVQPNFSQDAKTIYATKLINADPKDTNLVAIDLKSKTIKQEFYQEHNQVEPNSKDNINIYYNNLICLYGCEEDIIEIWHKNIITGIAKQLTLTNAMTRQLSVDAKNENIYFNSNKNGDFQLYKYNLKDKTTKQLTKGNSTYTYPAVCQSGTLYAIKDKEGKQELVKKLKDKFIKIELDNKFSKIRILRGN